MVLNFLNKKIILHNLVKTLGRIKKIKKILKTTKRFLHLEILHSITKSKIIFCKNENNIYLKNYNYIDFNVSTKQLILFKILYKKSFNNKIALSISNNKKMIFPIPKELHSLFYSQNIQLNKGLCVFLFYISCFKEIIKALFCFFQILIENNNYREKNYIQICNLPKNYNPNLKKKKILDIYNWILSNNKRLNNHSIYSNSLFDNFTRDNIKIYSFKNLIPQLNFLKRIKLTIWFFRMITYSIINLILGNWLIAFLSFELLQLKKQELSGILGKEYYFLNTEFIYRPLWTYFAEKKGSQINLFFYSSSFYGFKKDNRYIVNEAGLETMTWPNMIMWSLPLLDFIKSQVFKNNINFIYIPAPIDITDNDSLHEINFKKYEKIVTVFDAPPKRDSIRYLYQPQDFYRSEENGIKFLKNICDCLDDKLNIALIIKNKRILNKDYSKKYKKFMDNLSSKKQIFLIHPEISASQIVILSDAVISAPWTSTAQIANYYGVPNIYYDPSGILDASDRGAQNIKLIQNKEKLKIWLEKNCDIRSK